ncbi:hypothetical protein AZ037_002025, partial [Klebsiella michiganensis]
RRQQRQADRAMVEYPRECRVQC